MHLNIPPLIECTTVDLLVHPFKPEDRKCSFTTRPTGNMPGSRKCDKKDIFALFLTFTIYNNQHAGTFQQGSRGLFGWWGKPGGQLTCMEHFHMSRCHFQDGQRLTNALSYYYSERQGCS